VRGVTEQIALVGSHSKPCRATSTTHSPPDHRPERSVSISTGPPSSMRRRSSGEPMVISVDTARTMNSTVALIADIHGNLAALEAVLDTLAHEGPDQIVCLGDVAATGPQPHEVLDRLRRLGCPVVMGNADAELLDPDRAEPEAEEDARNILDISRWGASQLDAADRAFIASFRPTVDIALANGESRCAAMARRGATTTASRPRPRTTHLMAFWPVMTRSRLPAHTRTSACFVPFGDGRSSTPAVSDSPTSSSPRGACTCRHGRNLPSCRMPLTAR
jgi:hypothetical protein